MSVEGLPSEESDETVAAWFKVRRGQPTAALRRGEGQTDLRCREAHELRVITFVSHGIGRDCSSLVVHCIIPTHVDLVGRCSLGRASFPSVSGGMFRTWAHAVDGAVEYSRVVEGSP